MVVWRVWEISVKGSETFTINNAAFVVFISVDYETTTFPGYFDYYNCMFYFNRAFKLYLKDVNRCSRS